MFDTKLDYSSLIKEYSSYDRNYCCLCFDNSSMRLVAGYDSTPIKIDGLKYHKSCYETVYLNPVCKNLLKEFYDLYPEEHFDHFSHGLFREVLSLYDETIIDYKFEIDEKWLHIYCLYKDGGTFLKIPFDSDKFIDYEGMDFIFLRKLRNMFPNHSI